ncbi:MAG: type II toxin-antitoxin system HigA family antitoxin [Alphaproteobacteria bacterium]
MPSIRSPSPSSSWVPEIRAIRSDSDHAWALAEIERLWGSVPGTSDGDRLDVLVDLVEAYEERRWPIGAPDAVEMIRFRMEQSGYTTADLAQLLGPRSHAAEILSRKRGLTLRQIRLLSEEWRIPAETLIRAYALSS